MRHRNIFGALLLLLLMFAYRADAAVLFESDLYFGILSNPEVTRLQEFFKNQGVYDGPVTGNFLALTREGVKRFQSREGIEPPAGYFGPQTRARANDLLVGAVVSGEEIIARLEAQIAELQARLAELQKQLVEEQAAGEEEEPPQESADTTPPQFIVRPRTVEEGFVANPFPLGARYPYKVKFDWSVDEKGFVEESVSCSPGLKILKPAGKNTEYYPEPNTSYDCAITATDLAGNAASETLHFEAPGWVSVNGTSSALFPATAMSLMKLGDIAIHNGTTSDLLFAQLVMKVTDNMNSTLNRNREVIFTLRKGPTTSHDIISKTKLTFNSYPPDPNDPHKYFVNMEFPETLKKGEEKTYGLWVENLDYVISGLLRFEFDKFLSTIGVSPVGGFTFTLTREAK